MTNSSRTVASLLALILAFSLAQPALANGVADGNAGLEALNRGERGEAIRLFTRALKGGDLAADDQEFAYVNRARAYSETGDLISAIADLHQAVRLKPDDDDARAALQAAVEARRAQANGAPAPVAQTATRGGPFGFLESMAGTWWACTKDGGLASVVVWGPRQADSLAMSQANKSGAGLTGTFKLDPVAGVLFGFTYKGDAIYGVVDANGPGVTETFAMHGVPIRQTMQRTADGRVAEVSEAYRNGAWGPLEADDCRQTTAAEVSKIRWARKLRP